MSTPRPRGDELASMTARRVVPHSPEDVYAFLARLDNHWHLDDRYLRLAHVSPDQREGRIVIRAPLGLRRTARTTVTTTCEPSRLGGTATVGRRTTASVNWSIESHEAGADIALEAKVLEARPLDRLILSLGGSRWLRCRFQRVLSRLADALDHPLLSDRSAPARN